ncbi:pimelyl-ACP methyl ester esterase BioV [Helicobacter sp. 13S00477-4]|uniref:pimelyl-ACP methyl ester esterase BioV n=1 Tax=Helicobacter sp. 13S00477-4 TaxID=1905759 RepID=UPI000BA6D15F|nr:pimelyl-ACP methyl ester esterase BioV [Helicobacter sp. 13S00477-4]PAF51639.1 hypothetical protein BKH44_05350 [Helicobacter sp. 13S00477-4]
MYFSGFCFHNEESIFEDFIQNLNKYDIYGFSYGAQKAFEWVYQGLGRDRIQRLILFSPAIFNNKSKTYKEIQINAFKKDYKKYIEKFLYLAGFEDTMKKYFYEGNLKELQNLLGYTWDNDKLKQISEYGVEIEVYLGGCDKIVDTSYACDFFAPYGRIYFIKSANHFLKIK